MRGNVNLTAIRVVVGSHYANKLHHASIFVREDVAVEYKRPRLVEEFVPDSNPTWCNRLSVLDKHGRWYRNYVLPNKALGRCIRVIGRVFGRIVILNWSINLNHLKWIDMNVERMGNYRVVFEDPILQPLL